MKTICTFTLSLILLSCNTIKHNSEKNRITTNENKSTSQLIGKWKLIKTSGGITGKTQNQPINKLETLEFTKTEMIRTLNGKETYRTQYKLGTGKSIHSIEQVPMIFTSEDATKGQSYNIIGNTLGISQEFHDGFYYTYIKIDNNDDGLLRE